MQAFTWEQARERAIALAERTHQAVHVLQSGEEYFVASASDLQNIPAETPQIVFTAQPPQHAAAGSAPTS